MSEENPVENASDFVPTIHPVPPKPSVNTAWSAVMAAVQGIGKNDRNTAQNFNFRGIDAVMNAVGPALREHGVVVIPEAIGLETDSYTTSKGNPMRNVTVKMKYTIIGPLGDSIQGSAWGEASDSADKATSKATSVAYRTFLLQALTIPTDEPDPDSEYVERSAPPRQEPERPKTEADKARDRLRSSLERQNIALTEVAQLFEREHSELLRTCEDAQKINQYVMRFAERQV